ncbi:MAG: HAMP domain-containing protein [Firmicutes bacterium]|nr:HAMP domain-containing protein [Bacillota bacterium]
MKLAAALLVTTAGVFLSFGFWNLHLQRKHSEELILQSADRISDLILRSTHYQMLRNDREALYETINTIGREPGIRRIRIFNEEGRISFSTYAPEVNTYVDKQAEACYACHARSAPLTRLERPDRFRIFTDERGERVLGLIRPIENEPSCSNAACHAHPPDRRILGVIDADLSLATVDAQFAATRRQLWGFTVLAMLIFSGISALFVWVVVHRPIRELIAGMQRVAAGDLHYTLSVHTSDELGELAASFNKMTRELREARAELTAWAQTLEQRVEEKTRALQQAQEQMLRAERLASVGKLAAVVAHEINNPLAGILTYTKLLRRWMERDADPAARAQEVCKTLELIEAESRRCGEIVKNLLMFSRATPMNLAWVPLNATVEQALRLVRHQCELAGIEVHLDLDPALPVVRCDAAQIEQVLLALVMNAIEAMPRGGNLWLRTRWLEEADQVVVQVRDDGCGIAPEHLSQIFEPFFTTKEGAHGTGLGLAVSRGIVERHNGRIEVVSELGQGTTFTVRLPRDASRSPEVPAPARETQHVR